MPRRDATLLAAACLLVSGTSASAATHPCTEAVNGELKRLAADTRDIQTIFFDVRRTKDEQTQFLGHTGWVYYKRCSGPLVIELDPQCEVDRLYSTGNCRWDGVPSYR